MAKGITISKGNAAEKSEIALLLIDIINPLDFPEAKQMQRRLPHLIKNLSRLKRRAKCAGIPVIYVNDNFGRWRSDQRRQIEYCLTRDCLGRELVRALRPEEDDYFVLKPKHSGFFESALETLLRYLGVRRLILTGIAGNFCVLFTANDAYMRDYELIVPRDCAVSNTVEENRDALHLMKNYLKADTRPSARIPLARAKPRKRARR